LDKLWKKAPGEAIFIPGAEGRGEIRIEIGSTDFPTEPIPMQRFQALIELATSLAGRGQNVRVSSNGVEWSNTAGPIPLTLTPKLNAIIHGAKPQSGGILLGKADAESAAENIVTLTRSVGDGGLALTREGNDFRLRRIAPVPLGSSVVTPNLVVAAWKNEGDPSSDQSHQVYSVIRGPSNTE
jgi:hypothetical protein